ncbi:MAG: D-alanine--D-alanine ligase [Planctomycetota bacterium]|nr:MAG: D-alanine--D-alanine ligase [Planctomycetota bacterium]
MSRIAGKRVALLLGGNGSEREVSLATGEAMREALLRLGAELRVVDTASPALFELGQWRPELAVLAVHGAAGEDGRLQGYLDILGIPYTGSGVLGSALAMDKLRSKQIFASNGLATPRWVESTTISGMEPPFMPCVAKAANEGSSVGVHIVRSREDWAQSAELDGRSILIEEFIEGREFTVAVMDGRLLGVLEITTASGRYDYEAKYQRSDNVYTVLSPEHPRDGEMVRRMGELGLKGYAALGLRGVARVDLLLDERGPWLLEANTLPGMTASSLVPKIAASIGWDFDRLVEEIALAARFDG